LAFLLSAITGLAVFFAATNYLGSYATALTILFGLAVFAHVAGNALGTRLRDNGDRPLPPDDGTVLKKPKWRRATESDFAPATRLRERSALGKPTLIATGIGTVLGGSLGSYWLISQMTRVTPLTAGLAIGAAAILSGFWTFLAASFCQIALGAVWHAVRQPDRRHVPSDDR